MRVLKNYSYRDYQRRIKYNKKELRRLLVKAILCNETIDSRTRLLFRMQFNFKSTRIRSRCLVTNRGRAVFTKYRLSRTPFRMLASFGRLSGIRKANV